MASTADSPKPAFQLAELMRRAMRTSYGMIARDALRQMQGEATLVALIELMIEKGMLVPEELEVRRDKVERRLDAERMVNWSGPSLSPDAIATAPSRDVDCQSRHAQCQAACCVQYRVLLTGDEVREGRVLWDLAMPYQLPRGPEGHCANLERATLRCLIWDNRPAVCRGYSCETDNEVWDDFAKMIPAERVRARSKAAAARAKVTP